MKKIFLLLIVLFMLIGCTTSNSGSAAQTQQAGQQFGFEITKDWRSISIMLTLISGFLIAFAYMFGHAFEIPDLKAWAGIELVQVVATLIIVLAFGVVFTLLDTTVALAINSSNLGFTCTFLQNCATLTAENYLLGLIGLAENEVVDVADKALLASRMSAYRVGLGSPQAFWPPLLQSYFSFSPKPEWAAYAMDLELQTQLMQWHGGILSILSSQYFFVTQISFKMAPVLLLLGIVGRSFFVTRRLGGLLMAVGLGVMFVFPAMYVVNWISMHITLFGDDVEPIVPECPLACQRTPPLFYETPDKTYEDFADLKEKLHLTDDELDANNGALAKDLKKLRNGEIASKIVMDGTVSHTIRSCNYAADTDYGYCPLNCRSIPIPLGEICTYLNTSKNPDEDIKRACYSMPELCRITYEVDDPDERLETKCPTFCRTTLPLNPSCGNNCLSQRDYCRVARKEPSASGTGEILIPASILVNRGKLPPECFAVSAFCPETLNAENSCVYVQPTEDVLDRCAGCVFVPKEYTYDPPTYVDCASLCGGKPPKITAAEFAQITRKQMAGREEVTGVSSLIIPAYILPLLNVVVTLMFIRTFSPIFGGDVEIPGMAKLL